MPNQLQQVQLGNPPSSNEALSFSNHESILPN